MARVYTPTPHLDNSQPGVRRFIHTIRLLGGWHWPFYPATPGATSRTLPPNFAPGSTEPVFALSPFEALEGKRWYKIIQLRAASASGAETL